MQGFASMRMQSCMTNHFPNGQYEKDSAHLKSSSHGYVIIYD